MKQMVAKIVENPVGKGLRHLYIFLRANPDARPVLEAELKKQPRSTEFITYHLNKMDKSEKEIPEVTDELANVLETIRVNREALRNFHQTGWWTGAVNTSVVTPAVSSPAVKAAASRRSLQKAAIESAPDTESTMSVSRPKLTAIDVEPLKQLLNMRRQQQ